jgi:hypothetical protein
MITVPDWLVSPIDEFAGEYEVRRVHGATVLENASVAFVGLARNCARHLEGNLFRLSALTSAVDESRVLIVENDSTDNTKQVATSFAAKSGGRATAIVRDLGRQHRPTEMAGTRTNELAEYRAECQEWVRRHCSGFDYTVVVDWDSYGGWVLHGVQTGFSYLATDPGAFAMASVSLLEHPVASYDREKNTIVSGSQWIHYDCWAMRLNSYWDDYGHGIGGWKHNWFPLVGSPPVRMMSAFGGFCIYRTADYLRGTYSGQDCEHVTFHRSIQEATGLGLYLNPSQRMVMQWIEKDAKQNPDQPVQG